MGRVVCESYLTRFLASEETEVPCREKNLLKSHKKVILVLTL